MNTVDLDALIAKLKSGEASEADLVKGIEAVRDIRVAAPAEPEPDGIEALAKAMAAGEITTQAEALEFLSKAADSAESHACPECDEDVDADDDECPECDHKRPAGGWKKKGEKGDKKADEMAKAAALAAAATVPPPADELDADALRKLLAGGNADEDLDAEPLLKAVAAGYSTLVEHLKTQAERTEARLLRIEKSVRTIRDSEAIAKSAVAAPAATPAAETALEKLMKSVAEDLEDVKEAISRTPQSGNPSRRDARRQSASAPGTLTTAEACDLIGKAVDGGKLDGGEAIKHLRNIQQLANAGEPLEKAIPPALLNGAA